MTYPQPGDCPLPLSTLASIEADLNTALDGWMRTADELSNLRAEVVRLQDAQLWLTTALSCAMEILHAPEVAAVFRPVQQLAVERIDDGPDGPMVRIFEVDAEPVRVWDGNGDGMPIRIGGR